MKKIDFSTLIKTYIQENSLIKPGDHILVGLSGGPDSVCLLSILNKLSSVFQCTLSAAHVDHEWRTESPNDALFCKNLCAQLKIPFYQTTLSAISCPTKPHDSKESYARTKRRFYFKNLAHKIGAQRIALAHHKDDQMETFFIRLMRGSSVRGLSAMKPQDDLFIRPLLPTSKEAVFSYLHEHTLSYRIDESNDSDEFLRNRIRKYLLPVFLKIDARNSATFFSTLRNLQEEDDALNQLTHTFLTTSITPASIPLPHFITLPLALKKRVIIEWLCRNNIPFTPSNALLHEIIRFLEKSRQSTHQINQFFKIRKKKKIATIEPVL